MPWKVLIAGRKQPAWRCYRVAWAAPEQKPRASDEKVKLSKTRMTVSGISNSGSAADQN